MRFKQYGTTIRHYIAFPFIWLPLVAIILADILIELYHRVCFPLYRIPYVSRKSYVRIDRYKLPYLSFIEKIFCLYCEYANGVLNYCAAIAGETEKYWCGIKHQNQNYDFIEPSHQKDFLEYGNQEEYDSLCKLHK